MRVRMNKQTRWNGEVLRPGDTPDIETSAAERWIKNKIAEPVSLASESNIVHLRSPVIVKDLENKKYNELRKIASGKGITVLRGTKKPALIDLILQSSAETPRQAQGDDEDENAVNSKKKVITFPGGAEE